MGQRLHSPARGPELKKIPAHDSLSMQARRKLLKWIQRRQVVSF